MRETNRIDRHESGSHMLGSSSKNTSRTEKAKLVLVDETLKQKFKIIKIEKQLYMTRYVTAISL